MSKMMKVSSLHPFDEVQALIPRLSDEEFAALKADVAEHKILTPVLIAKQIRGEGYLILDGHHRVQAAHELGWTEVPATHLSGLDEEARFERALKANTHRRHLSREQKRELAAGLLRKRPERSNRAIAELVGISDHTVASVRADLEATAQIAQLNQREGRDGKARPAQLSRQEKSASRGTHNAGERARTESDLASEGEERRPNMELPEAVVQLIEIASAVLNLPDSEIRAVDLGTEEAEVLRQLRNALGRILIPYEKERLLTAVSTAAEA